MVNQPSVKRRRQEDFLKVDKEVSIHVRSDSKTAWQDKGGGILDVSHSEEVMMVSVKSEENNLLEELLYDDIYTLKDNERSVTWKVADRELTIQIIFSDQQYFSMFKGFLSFHFHKKAGPTVPSIFKQNTTIQDYRTIILKQQQSPLEKVVVANSLLEYNHLPKIIAMIGHPSLQVSDIITGVVALGYPPLLEFIFQNHRNVVMEYLLSEHPIQTYGAMLDSWSSIGKKFDCSKELISLISVRFIRNHIIANKSLKEFESSIIHTMLLKIFTSVSINTSELKQLSSGKLTHLLGLIHYITSVEKQVEITDLLTSRSRDNNLTSVLEIIVHEEDRYGDQLLHQLISRFGDRRCEEPLIPIRKMLIHPRSELLWSALLKRLKQQTDGSSLNHILGLHDREGDIDDRNRCVEVVEGRDELAKYLAGCPHIFITPLISIISSYLETPTDDDDSVVVALSIITKIASSPHLREIVFPVTCSRLIDSGVFTSEMLRKSSISKFVKIGLLQVAKSMINTRNEQGISVGTYFAAKGFAEWAAVLVGKSACENSAVSSSALSLITSSCKTLRSFYCSMHSDIVDTVPALSALRDTWKSDLRRQWTTELEHNSDCDTTTECTPVKGSYNTTCSVASRTPDSIQSSPSTLSSCSTECADGNFTDFGDEALWNPRSALNSHEGPPTKVSALSSFLRELPRRPAHPLLRNSAPPPTTTAMFLTTTKRSRRPLSELRNV